MASPSTQIHKRTISENTLKMQSIEQRNSTIIKTPQAESIDYWR